MMWFFNFVGSKDNRWTGRIIAMVTLGLMLATSAQNKQPTTTENPEEMGVRVAIEHYFSGHATGDASHMRMAFLPTAHIEGIRDGEFTSWTLDKYCENSRGRPASDESTRSRKIDSIDVTGSAAIVKATLVHGPTTFTDYFVLLKVDGEWKIANKVYHAQRQ